MDHINMLNIRIIALFLLAPTIMLTGCASDRIASDEGSSDTNTPTASSISATQLMPSVSKSGTTHKPKEQTSTPFSDTPSSQTAKSLTTAAVKPHPADEKNQFHIASFFAFGGSGDRVMYDKVVRQTREASFTTIEITNIDTSDPSLEGPAPDAVRRVIRTALDACRNHDMMAIIADPYLGGAAELSRNIEKKHVRQALDAYSGYKDILLGYLLWDEPLMEQFPIIDQRIKWIREYDKDVRLFVNLLPSYNMHYTWKNGKFDNYLDAFIKTVNPEMLSVDYYVFGHDTDCNPDVLSASQELWRDMGYFRKRALETGKPFEFYIQGVGDFSASKNIGNMTAERISFQMYAALAYGVKRVSYFTSYGLVLDSRGNKTKMYDSVKAINEEALAVGRFLYDKTPMNIYHSGVGKLSKVRNNFYLDNLEKSSLLSEVPADCIVSVFKGKDGRKYIMVANKSYKYPASGRLVLKKKNKVSRFRAENSSFERISGSSTSISITIPAGGYSILQIG